MYNHRARPFVDRYGRQKPGFDGYDCSVYKLSYRKTSETQCFSHHISTKALREIILYTIQNVCKYAIEDREAFIRKVRQETEARNAFAEREGKKKYDADTRRVQELDVLYRKLYESFATGIISEDKFKMLSESYEAEQAKLKAERERTIQEFNKEVESTGLDSMPVIPERVIREVRSSTIYAPNNL